MKWTTREHPRVVVQSFDTDPHRTLETVATEAGAHTIGRDPGLKQLWAFAPTSCVAIVYQDAA